jgi:hypothetical protein
MAKKQPATGIAPVNGDEVPAAPPAVKKLPVTTRSFVNPDTYDTMVVVHDPNAGTYTETVTSKATGAKTVTVHKGISHTWARWEEQISPDK